MKYEASYWPHQIKAARVNSLVAFFISNTQQTTYTNNHKDNQRNNYKDKVKNQSSSPSTGGIYRHLILQDSTRTSNIYSDK